MDGDRRSAAVGTLRRRAPPLHPDARHRSDERLGIRVLRRVEHRLRRPLLHNAAVAQNDDVVGDLAHDGEVVTDEEIAEAQLLSQVHEEVQRSEEHTSALQLLMRISYAVCCLKEDNNWPRQDML